MSELKLNYPFARRDDEFSEKIHNVDVPDPYRWLEKREDEEVQKFVVEQQNLTMSYIQDVPDRSEIKEKLTDLFNYPKLECPFKRGNNYFIFKNLGLQNQSVMYKFKNLNDEHEVFLDPNTFSEEGTSSLGKYSFSKDGNWIAYSVSKGGSDWHEIFIRNVETKQDLPDKLKYVKFTSISWTHDNLGFFYSKFEKEGDVLKEIISDQNHKLFYHRINTLQSEDVLVYDTPDHPEYLISGTLSHDGKILNVFIMKECLNTNWYYAKLDENHPIQKKFNIYPIAENFQDEYSYITNNDDLMYFKTNKDAPNFKFCKLNINYPDSSNWIDIIPEDKEAVMDEVICVDEDKLAVIYIKDVINYLEIRALEDGKLLKKFDIPIGTIGSFSGRRVESEIFFSVTSFLIAKNIYYYDFKNKESDLKVFNETKIKNFNASDFLTKQVFLESKDGNCKVPMFITHHKDIEMNSNNPCLLYGYGGFAISLQPYFSSSRLLFMKHFKGVYAVCNMRGGGEYGSKWHDAGRLLNKQNTCEDFQQAGEYLIEKGYTCKEKLIIEGGSNGGLIVGICANQRPDLFAASIIHVGVLDFLRYQKFTGGIKWNSDYGDHENEKEDAELHFKNKLKLSPLHNVPKNCSKYPATLLLTSDHDNRVVPLHSYKHIAELQHTIGRRLNNPLLLRVDLNCGHGFGKSTEKILNQATDIFCFIQKALNLKFYSN